MTPRGFEDPEIETLNRKTPQYAGGLTSFSRLPPGSLNSAVSTILAAITRES